MQNIVNNYAVWVSEHARNVLIAVAVLTLLMASQMLFFTINPTPYFLSKAHSSRIADANTKMLFTNTGEFAFVAVTTKEDSIFNPESLQTIQTLSQQFDNIHLVSEKDSKKLSKLRIDKRSSHWVDTILAEGIDVRDQSALKQLEEHLLNQGELRASRYVKDLGIRVQPIRQVRSLATLDDLAVYQEEGEQVLDVQPLMDGVPKTASQSTMLADKVMSNPLYSGLLIADTTRGPVKASSIQIELRVDEDDSPNLIRVYNKIQSIVDAYEGQDFIYIGGPPMVTAQTSYEMESNNFMLMPFVIMMVSLVLFVCFRRLQGVVIPLCIAIVTTIWTLSFMAFCGISQNIVTTALPVFLIAIAVADAIHFLNAYYLQSQQQSKKEAIKHCFTGLMMPLMFTSVTSIVGFLAVANTDLQFMREFGLFVAFGIAIAFLLTITLLPALLVCFDQNTEQKLTLRQATMAMKINQYTVAFVNAVQKNKTAFSGFLCLLFLLAGFSLKDLVVNNEVVGIFSEDTRIRVDEEHIKQSFGGTTPFSIVLSADEDNAFKEPDVIHAIDKLAAEVKQLASVGYVSSLADFVKRSYQQQEDAGYQLPENANAAMISQYLFTYENAEQQEIRDVVDLSYRHTRIFITLNSDSSQKIDDVFAAINRLAPEILPEGIDYRMTGFAEILSMSTQEIVINQFENNFIAVAAIFFMLLLLFRSMVLALIGILPLTCTVYFVFSLMAFLDMPLDIGTALVSCITFGIGIDYAIHFISVLKRECQKNTTTIDIAIKETVNQVASPILVNSFALALGFLVLIVAGYGPIVNLGIIISAAMLICATLTLLMLPLLFQVINPAVLVKGRGQGEVLGIDTLHEQ